MNATFYPTLASSSQFYPDLLSGKSILLGAGATGAGVGAAAGAAATRAALISARQSNNNNNYHRRYQYN